MKNVKYLFLSGITLICMAAGCGYFGETTGHLVFLPIGVFAGFVGGSLVYMAHKLSISQND